MMMTTAITLLSLASRFHPEPELIGSPLPPEWTAESTPSPQEPLTLTVALAPPPGAIQRLEDELLAVSTPSHPRYGQHLTADAARGLAAPPAAEAARVREWLQDGGAAVEAQGALLRARLTVAAAERLFNCTLQWHAHRSGVRILRARRRAYSVPAGLAVLVVDGLAAFPGGWQADTAAPSSPRPTSAGAWPSDCPKCQGEIKMGDRVTPAVLTQVYQLGARPAGAAKGSLAVAEFQSVFWDQEDLAAFGAACSLGNITVDRMVGENKPRSCRTAGILRPNLCTEALLDIQTAKGLIGTIPLTDVYDDGYSLLNWARQLAAMGDGELPLVHSVSYGNDEAQQTSAAYMLAVSAELMKLGARGASILFASGDQGVIGRAGSGRRYHPGFPATSPYVTSVGGTNFATRGVIGAESAWFGSGGGFSDTFGIPAWQSSAVAAYLAEAQGQLPPATAWNASGRGFPDVAALGGQLNQYCIVRDSAVTGAYGTSAATPVFASVVAKLNERRLAASKPPMGFLNPFLYAHPAALHDVTLGRNSGSPNSAAKGGFPALKGWDPATGLGTPNFEALAAAAMAIVQQ